MSFSTAGDSSTSGRRLSSRRGSLSAPDPFAQNMTLDTPSGRTSRLTIVRVPSSECSNPATGGFKGEEVVILQSPRMRAHSSASMSNSGKTSGWVQPRPGSDNGDGRKARMSFAFSSFTPIKPPSMESSSTSDTTSSPSRSPPRSPVRTFTAKHRTRSNPSLPAHGFSAFQTRRPSLSPQQICDLARTSLMGANEGTPAPVSPRSAGYSGPFSSPPRDTTHADTDSTNSPDLRTGSPTPFIPLPESHYLPFIDRPSEVRDLLSSDSNRRFMALLKQTFPLHLRDALGNPDEQNPIDWSYPSLVSFLTECPRSKSPDTTWVAKLRQCIRIRSEVVWERVKDILGVPPELDSEESEEADVEQPEQEELDDAWAEPIYSSSSPLFMGSPVVTSASPIDMGDGASDFGFGGRSRGNGMETIGEGEEEDNLPTITNCSRPNSVGVAGQEVEPIRALRLCTRLSFSEDHNPHPEASAVPPSDGTSSRAPGRSLSHGHIGLASVQNLGGRRQSFTYGHVRRPSADRPEFERGPGNPLFPSNFGRLSIGPTLPANNPALRHQFAPLPSAYLAPSSRRYTHTAAEPFHLLSADRLQPSKSGGSDYALTLPSGSSDKSSAASASGQPPK